jgi:transcriptional regulator with XRE-family HTH domain
MVPCLATRLKAVRRAKGLTQKQLADKAGIELSCLSRYEGGIRNPSVYNLLWLSQALGVSMDYLMGMKS